MAFRKEHTPIDLPDEIISEMEPTVVRELLRCGLAFCKVYADEDYSGGIEHNFELPGLYREVLVAAHATAHATARTAETTTCLLAANFFQEKIREFHLEHEKLVLEIDSEKKKDVIKRERIRCELQKALEKQEKSKKKKIKN